MLIFIGVAAGATQRTLAGQLDGNGRSSAGDYASPRAQNIRNFHDFPRLVYELLFNRRRPGQLVARWWQIKQMTNQPRRNTRVAFNPPNANELEIAYSTSTGRAWFAITSSWHAGSSSVKFAVGGSVL
jgi:hypothetical protein